MPTKRKSSSSPAPSKGRAQPAPAQLPLAPAPAERLARLLTDAKARGSRPMAEDELTGLIETHRDAWPDEQEIDAFIAWLHKARREGRYD